MSGKLLSVAAVLVAVACFAPAPAEAKTYVGVVGPGFTITLKSAQRNAVRRIRTGTHTFKIRDRSSRHNFHLLGPGINKKTRVAFVGRKTWKLTFSEGRYRYRCDPHREHMRGSFRAVA